MVTPHRSRWPGLPRSLSPRLSFPRRSKRCSRRVRDIAPFVPPGSRKERACPQEKRLEAGCAPSSLVSGRSGQSNARSRSEEHTSELQSLMRISYAVFCLKKKQSERPPPHPPPAPPPPPPPPPRTPSTPPTHTTPPPPTNH